MKALTILKKYPSIEERANTIIVSLKRDVQMSVLYPVQNKVDRLEDEIAELKNFSLKTNHNEGQVSISKEECKKRFEQIIQKSYELEIAKKELEIKTKTFDEYFTEDKIETSASL